MNIHVFRSKKKIPKNLRFNKGLQEFSRIKCLEEGLRRLKWLRKARGIPGECQGITRELP